jgi:hypothetical protein
MVQLRLLAALKSTGQRITAGYSHDKRKLLAENTLHFRRIDAVVSGKATIGHLRC